MTFYWVLLFFLWHDCGPTLFFQMYLSHHLFCITQRFWYRASNNPRRCPAKAKGLIFRSTPSPGRCGPLRRRITYCAPRQWLTCCDFTTRPPLSDHSWLLRPRQRRDRRPCHASGWKVHGVGGAVEVARGIIGAVERRGGGHHDAFYLGVVRWSAALFFWFFVLLCSLKIKPM